MKNARLRSERKGEESVQNVSMQKASSLKAKQSNLQYTSINKQNKTHFLTRSGAAILLHVTENEHAPGGEQRRNK